MGLNFFWISIKVKEIALSKVDELQEELDAKMEERSRHGKSFDEIDLFDMEEQCRITGMNQGWNRDIRS